MMKNFSKYLYNLQTVIAVGHSIDGLQVCVYLMQSSISLSVESPQVAFVNASTAGKH